MSEEELQQRLASAHAEREKARLICDHIIMTDGNLEENVQRVRAVLDKILEG
jgi:dephospho-CoA kinase